MTMTEAQGSDRRERTHEMVRKLLGERREMLSMFCRVAGLEPYSDTSPNGDVLQEFCQVLVDYSAFGHFEICTSRPSSSFSESFSSGASQCPQVALTLIPHFSHL